MHLTALTVIINVCNLECYGTVFCVLKHVIGNVNDIVLSCRISYVTNVFDLLCKLSGVYSRKLTFGPVCINSANLGKNSALGYLFLGQAVAVTVNVELKIYSV